MNGASARKTVFPAQLSLLTRAQFKAAASIPRAIATAGNGWNCIWLNTGNKLPALTTDFAGMVDIKHGELRAIVLKHAETVNVMRCSSAIGWLTPMTLPKAFRKTCKLPLPNGINPKTIWHGNGSD